jgi:hypothetical protein
MPKKTDITLTLPAEYFDTLSVVIAIGLKHATINPMIRKELEAWWSVERELIESDLLG